MAHFNGTESRLTIDDTQSYQEISEKGSVKVGTKWFVLRNIDDSPWVDLLVSDDFTTWTSCSMPSPTDETNWNYSGFTFECKPGNGVVYVNVRKRISGERVILTYTISTDSWSQNLVATGYSATVLMEIDSSYNIHLISGNNSAIKHNYYTGGSWTTWETISANTPSYINGICIDTSNNIHGIFRYSGNEYYFVGTRGSWNVEQIAGAINNQDICVATNGTVYIAGYFASSTPGKDSFGVYYGSYGSWNSQSLDDIGELMQNYFTIDSIGNDIHCIYSFYNTTSNYWIRYIYYNGSWSTPITMETDVYANLPDVLNINAESTDIALFYVDGNYDIIYGFYSADAITSNLKKLLANTWTAYPLKTLIAGVWTEKTIKNTW
jgi:hypothetical protein